MAHYTIVARSCVKITVTAAKCIEQKNRLARISNFSNTSNEYLRHDGDDVKNAMRPKLNRFIESYP